MLRFNAIAAFTAYSSTFWLSTGKVPGSPHTTGSMWVFGSSPNAVDAAVKILLSVPSCTWVSRPITASQAGSAAAISASIQTGESYGRAASVLTELLT